MNNYASRIFDNNKPLGEAVALVDGNGLRSISRRELYEKSCAVAAYASAMGLQGLVPVCMPRCAETVEVLLGLALAGLGVAPLSDKTPAGRLELIEQQTGNTVWTGKQYVEAVSHPVSGFEPVAFAEEAPAYVVYTSGSTGVPKGVVLSSSTVEKSYKRMASPEFLNLEPGDRVLQNASFSFVALMIDLYAPLYSGCVSHILPEEARTDVQLMTEYINTHGITSMFITPKPLSRLGNTPSLKNVCVGGERVVGLAPKGYRLLNVWGMSETAALALGYPISRAMEKTPIGKSRGDFRCYVLNEQGQLAEEGELCLSGAISSGYFKRPDLTEESFEPNPFCSDKGHETLMHTGDVVRRLEDGNLLYLNRKDFMVKINGQRVEPGEAEAVLEQVPGVKGAAVKAFTEDDGHSYLCAYFTAEDTVSEELLRAQLKKKLPAYMIPAFYVRLDALPLNSNGKLDRRALEPPKTASLQSEYVPPHNEAEAALCKAFQKVLKTELVGVNDDFIRLGGDSIRAMSVVSLAQLQGLNPALVLSCASPARIAAALAAQQGEDVYTDLPKNPDKAPLTPSQLGIYLECAGAPESIKYNIPFAVTLKRPRGLSLRDIERAADSVLALHPALYSCIQTEAGDICMCRRPFPREGICKAQEMPAQGFEAVRAEFVRPFDLGLAPLCRVKALVSETELQLIIDTHHIVSDGSSTAVLVKQLCSALAGGEPKPEKIDAFSLYEVQKRNEEKKLSKARAHFESLLAGVETDSNLIPDRSSTLVNPPAERLVLNINSIDFSALRRKGITESSLFMGAFGYALAKITGQSESLFAVAESGRKHGELDSTVSMLVRTLPVYMQLDENASPFELLSNLQRQFFSSIDGDVMSFRELNEEYGVNSDVMFVYQSDMLSNLETPAGRVSVELIPTGSAISNFNAAVFKNPEGHRAVLEYRPDLYNESTIRRFGEIFINAAEAMACDGDLKTVQLTASADMAFLDSINSTESPYNAAETIVDIIHRNAELQPEKPLVVYKEREYSYRQGEDMAERIAAHIGSLGIGKGQVVSVLINRSEYLLLASLGVMKSGALYQPLDPSYPSDRLSFMVKDADAGLVIADRELISLLPGYKGPVLFTDEIPALPRAELKAEPPKPEDGMVLLYTSGTTGVPKGCKLVYSNLTAMVHAFAKLTQMSSDSIAGAYASYGFDAHMADLYPVLSRGGTVVIVPDEIRLDLPAVKDYVESHRVSHFILTTQLCVQFVAMYKRLDYLKCLMAGGEKMVSLTPPETYRLINAYGPTETSVLETAFTVDGVYDDIPIGSPLANTKLYVVDSANRRVPVGVPGELVISGPQVASCYINRPEQTEKVFVPNSFEPNPPAAYRRCYRTGDIVRFTEDGLLRFMGRRDKQVKIRGFRIELSEVEKVILDYPGVTAATLVAVDSPAGGKALNAYIVGEGKINIQKLNEYITSVKPAYMVPAASMQLDSLPLTVNGKVDKRRLPKMEQHFDDLTKPENELQQRIFNQAAEAVGARDFGINTDLFAAGLSSLGSIRLCTMLAEEFGVPVQIRNIKKYPTVKKLEQFITKAITPDKDAGAAAADGEGVPGAVRYGEDYPVTKNMEGIFTECISKPDSTFYNIPYLLKLSPEINEQKIRAALAAAVEAHPYMKAELFTDSEGRLRQHAPLNAPFTPDMIKTLEAQSINELKPQLVKPFTITGSRLFEITLIRAGSLYLFLNVHHIISDGTGMNIFLKDVEKAYRGEALSPEAYSGFSISEEEQRARAGEDLQEAKDYYANLLEGIDKDFLPAADKYLQQEPASGKLNLKLRGVSLEEIGAFCRANRVSPNAFFVSAFGFTLARWFDTDYSVFNTVYNGRNDSRTANTFAMLVKTLPVVCNAENKDTASGLASEITAQLMDSMANDLYSYGEIARAHGLNNDVMFIYQGDSFSRSGFCGAPAEEISLSLSGSKAPMALQVMLQDGEIVCDLEYDPLRFTEKLMLSFLSAFNMVCLGFARNDRLSEISLVSPQAEAELEEYNNTEMDYDRSSTVTGLFHEQVMKQPHRLCIAYKDKRFSFAHAWEIAGKVALFLMEKGIGRGDVVPILINRDENMVLTAHGVVRAGAAYLGLDPTYPADRLEFMISDSGAKYLIADRSLMDKVPGYMGPVLYTDELDSLPTLTEEREAEFRAQPKYEITPENDALIIYSSGTTGQPKGSVLQHKAIVCFFHNYSLDVKLSAESNVATYASFGFDGGAQDVFSCPMKGASLFVIPDEIRLDLSALEQFYVRNNINIGFMTTQVGTMFISRTKCRSLRNFIVGGEKFIPVMPPEWISLQNGYGPSETMCYVNRYFVKDTGSLQPIGKVSHNIKEYIIDKFGKRQPFGACGELCISGGQMGRGYLNRPEKTEQVFVPNPFCSKEGYTKMYRTGDVVRLLPDGNYDFVGRRDGQVKIRGFRVELSEVEMQIRKFPGVEKTVVTAFDNPAGGKYLSAYVVGGDIIDIPALKAFIAGEKPDYMVPAVIQQLPEIPLTSNGKVDVRKLPKGEPGSAKKSAEPANETEEKLCSIFAEVLGLEKVYADDDFFSIGGSSISAIQVVVKCEQAGMNLVYKNLFANPTPQKLSAFLQDGREEDIKAADLEKGDGHDYSALKYNVPENLPNIVNRGVGDVLLTGATGFLGSHVFRELLNSTGGRVICLVRSKTGISAEDRLEMMMVYYFEEWYNQELSSRVTVIDGDMEQEETLARLKQLHFDTIINCAANVKHFAAGDELLGSNFNGVENLIALAEETGAKLIQISSLSVCGESVNGSVPAGYRFCETDLNIGQSLENKYIYTKYLAEQALIDAVSAKRIRGKVIRLGNLQARYGDSEFQVNAGTNGFLRLFIGFNALGCFPVGMMDSEVEFSPIDAVARAVVLLAGTPDDFTVFHAKNCNSIHYGYFLQALLRHGKPIEIVEDSVFEKRLEKALENEANVEKLGGLLAYKNDAKLSLHDTLKFYDDSTGDREQRMKIGSDTTFTTRALYRLGFSWPLISDEYLNNMVNTLLEMNIFTDK